MKRNPLLPGPGTIDAVVKQHDSTFRCDPRVVHMPRPPEIIPDRRQQSRLQFRRPVGVIPENPYDFAALAVDLENTVLKTKGHKDTVIPLVVGHAVAMCPVGSARKAADMPVGIQRVITDTIGVKMVETVPTPHHLARRGELDNHITDDFTVRPDPVRLVNRCRPVLYMARMARQSEEITIRHLVRLVVKAAHIHSDATVKSPLWTLPGIPRPNRLAGHVDFTRAGLRIMNEQVPVLQLLDTGHALAELPHPAHAAAMIHSNDHAPLRGKSPLCGRHVGDTSGRTTTHSHEGEIASHARGI